MIPHRWYAILWARSLRRRPLGLQRLDRRLVLWRDARGRPAAALDRCPHRGAALSPGRVREGELECPYHGFRFDARGACTRVPCDGEAARISPALQLDRVAVREAHGLLWAWAGAAADAPPEVPWFDELPADFRGDVRTSAVWPCHYTRAVENFLDPHHVPFVHRRLTPGLGAPVSPCEAGIEGDRVWTRGRIGAGRRHGGFRFRLEVVVPGLALIEIHKARAVATLAPVDGRRTWISVRYDQSYTRLPGIAQALSLLFYAFDWGLAQYQDRRVLRTVRPAAGSPHSSVLVRADRAIALWLGRRQELLQELGKATGTPDAVDGFRSRSETRTLRAPSPRKEKPA